MFADIYHSGNREWQDQFDSRRLADRLHDRNVRERITDNDRSFIESRDMFFISTVDELGRPTVSYKGGNPGFVRVINNETIVFPGYDGNGMFLTAGNIHSNHHVGILFIDFEKPRRLRLHGSAVVELDDPLIQEFEGAQYIVHVAVRNLFDNCPRYIHQYRKIKISKYIPQYGCDPPVPEWKESETYRDVLPDKD